MVAFYSGSKQDAFPIARQQAAIQLEPNQENKKMAKKADRHRHHQRITASQQGRATTASATLAAASRSAINEIGQAPEKRRKDRFKNRHPTQRPHARCAQRTGRR